MKDTEAVLVNRRHAGPDTVVLELHADFAREALPGQFVNVKVPSLGYDPFLRRPFSVAWAERKERRIELLVQVRGRGSRALAQLAGGARLSLLGPLGRGFPVERLLRQQAVDLIGGACGVAPLLFLAQVLLHEQNMKRVRLFVGAQTQALMPEPKVIAERFPQVVFATDDGSLGFHGTVMDCFLRHAEENPVLCACGPTPLLEEVRRFAVQRRAEAYLSLESHMACGFGVCNGCVVRESSGRYLNVCSDGPVFQAGVLAPLSTEGPPAPLPQ